MELFFLFLLVVIMAYALGSGYPVAFALPGAAILTIGLAAGTGLVLTGNADAYFSHGGPAQWLSAGVTNFRGIYWEAERDTLIAIPLFVFMGIMLQRSKIAEDLLVTMAQLFGPVPGGLGISVVFVGALLAATTGIVGATVVAMGLISLPAMLRNNYSPALATGTIAASGTLGQIIPPSIVLIILADQLSNAVDQAGTARQTLYRENTGELSMPSDFAVTSTSAGEMFLGAFIPGLVLVGLYMAFILAFALFRPKMAPAVPREGAFDRAFFVKVLVTLVPPLALIVLVLGSIIGGIATVNQAGAIGAVGATIMAGYKLREGKRGAFAPAIVAILALIGLAVVLSFGEVNVRRVDTQQDLYRLILATIAVGLLLIAILWSGWRTLKFEETLRGVMIDTAKTTSLVFIILLGAAMLTSAFRAFGGEEIVKEFLGGLPGGFWTQFFIVMLVIFVLGFFLDFIEIAVVVVPIVAPILLADPSANVTAVWLGVMIGLNIQTSFLTPPFGFALFYLRGVAPAAVKTLSMYRGVVAFIALQLLALVIVGFNPQLVNYLPNRSSLLSETAPPPKNPRLQYCLEQYAAAQYATRSEAISAAITRMSQTDIAYLPADVQELITGSVESAGQAMPQMQAIQDAVAAIDEATPAYRPLHRLVRALERDARRLDERIEELDVVVQRSGPNGVFSAERGEAARQRITELEAEKEALLSQIPAEWQPKHETFLELQSAEINARRTYRRTIDSAYDPLIELTATLDATEDLRAIEGDIRGLPGELRSMTLEEFEARVTEVRDLVGAIPGAGDIRSAVNQARREIRGNNPDPEAAAAALVEANAEFDRAIAWRTEAIEKLAPAIAEYRNAIGDPIGLRGQPRLPRDQALFVAHCNAAHRDVSLSF